VVTKRSTLKNQVSCERPGFFCFFNTDDNEMHGSPYMDNGDDVGNAYMDDDSGDMDRVRMGMVEVKLTSETVYTHFHH
jgi:hypothetical protein